MTFSRILPCICALAVLFRSTGAAQENSPAPTAPTASEQRPLPHDEFPLWPQGAPGALGTASKDTPSLTPFFPPTEKATGAALIVCPGGGYAMLASHEGESYARWLNEQGITAFVLKYRLGFDGYRHPAMLQDGQRAIRVVRAHAADWQLDPRRVGIVGSSAGGHLASTCLTHFDAGQADAPDPVDRVSSRPDLGVLCYPVITMGANTHAGSRENLLGSHPDPALVELLSNEKQVSQDTPPTFLFHTADDPVVSVANSLEFAAALQRHGVSFALHIYPHGPHGLGLGAPEGQPEHRHPWTTECARWLKERQFGR